MRKLSQKDFDILFEKYINNSCTEEEIAILLPYLCRKGKDYSSVKMKEYWDKLKSPEILSASELDYRYDENFNTILNIVKKQEQRNKSIRLYTISFVASIVLIIFLITINDHRNIEVLSYSENIIPKGQQVQLKLTDGSSVKINSASCLSVSNSFDEGKRELKLTGEAFFKVARDTVHPFIINCDYFKIQVIGTQFNVKSYKDDEFASVTVVSGKVKVFSVNGDSTVIIPGQQYLFDKKVGSFNVRASDTLSITGWTRGKLIFNKTPLKEVARMVERYYGLQVVIESPEKQNLELTGEHQNENIYSVAEALKYSLHIKYSIKNNVLLIK